MAAELEVERGRWRHFPAHVFVAQAVRGLGNFILQPVLGKNSTHEHARTHSLTHTHTHARTPGAADKRNWSVGQKPGSGRREGWAEPTPRGV